MIRKRHTLCSAVIVAILSALIVGCGQNPVEMVKAGHLESNESTSIGDAIDHYRYFRGVQWRAEVTANGRQLVVAACPVDLDAMTFNDLHARYFALAGMAPDNPNDPDLARPVSTGARAAAATFEFVLNGRKSFTLNSVTISITGLNGEEASSAWDDAVLQESLDDIYEDRLAVGFLGLLTMVEEQ